ncbi:MAG: hypothetical protein HDT28_04805 [Clostridiales bacterium]|nr:hypothetical protein [Clostridiales bacterium]
MAAPIINFEQLTPALMMQISDIVREEVITRGIISNYVDVVSARDGERIPFLGTLSKIGKVGRGCNITDDEASANLTEKKWLLKDWDFRLPICYKEFEKALYDLGLKEGVERPDLTGTPLLNLILSLVEGAVDEMLNRFLWFGDTTGANLPEESTEQQYFEVVDGVFKQIAEMITANNGIKHISIAANALNTTAAQQAAEGLDAINILSQVINEAPAALRAQRADNREVLVTDAFFSKLKMQLLAQTLYTESAYKMREDGIQELRIFGEKIVTVPYWDKEINASFNDGTKLDNPYRVLYTTKENIKLGFPVLDDQMKAFEDFKAWYDNKTKNMYIDGAGRLDVKVVLPQLISVAY